MFDLFNRLRQRSIQKQAEKQSQEICAEYFALTNPAPPQSQPSAMERYFEIKSDILRYNMSKTATVPTEGNEGNDFGE